VTMDQPDRPQLPLTRFRNTGKRPVLRLDAVGLKAAQQHTQEWLAGGSHANTHVTDEYGFDVEWHAKRKRP
jgi:hypothetical protein